MNLITEDIIEAEAIGHQTVNSGINTPFVKSIVKNKPTSISIEQNKTI